MVKAGNQAVKDSLSLRCQNLSILLDLLKQYIEILIFVPYKYRNLLITNKRLTNTIIFCSAEELPVKS